MKLTKSEKKFLKRLEPGNVWINHRTDKSTRIKCMGKKSNAHDSAPWAGFLPPICQKYFSNDVVVFVDGTWARVGEMENPDIWTWDYYVKPSNKEQDVIASVKKSWKKRDASFKKVKAEKKGIVTVAIEDVINHFYDLLEIGPVIEENVRLKQERDALKAKFDTIVAAFEKVR